MLSKNILDSSYNLVYDNINRSANNVERVRIRGSTEYFDTQGQVLEREFNDCGRDCLRLQPCKQQMQNTTKL
jgi:hypothetical protein